MKVIVWVLVLWIVISVVYGMKKRELDMSPFTAHYRIAFREHPIITIVVTTIIIFILYKLLF